jgi:predicted RNA-binding protein YlxR (DUF448 family)
MARRKHKPQRMCVACRQSQDKKTLLRLVRTQDGVFIDETGKLPGRGAYLHADPSCWERGVKKYLQQALRTTFTEADLERLSAYLDTIKVDSEADIQEPNTGESEKSQDQ